jgi:hypothetical protein
MNTIRILIYIYSFFAFSLVHAQKADTLQLQNECLKSTALSDSILHGSNDSVKIEANRMFTMKLDSMLKDPSSFNYSFAPFRNLSVLTSDNSRLKIYTWMVPLSDGMNFDFFGFVQVRNNDQGFSSYKLREQEYPANEEAEFLKLSDTSWYGALYYRIIYKHYKGKDQYILLGWQGKDRFTTRKIIDNISVSASKIEFGKPVFKAGGKARSRIIMEYNATANVSLNYNDNLKMIVFDHLSSSDQRPESKGMFSLYGPDMTYDAFRFINGFWVLQKNIEVTNRNESRPKNVKLNHDLRLQRKE